MFLGLISTFRDDSNSTPIYTYFHTVFMGKYFSRIVVRLGTSYQVIPGHDYIGTVLFISQFLRHSLSYGGKEGTLKTYYYHHGVETNKTAKKIYL